MTPHLDPRRAVLAGAGAAVLLLGGYSLVLVIRRSRAQS